MLNKVELIGRLGKDPEVTYLQGNVAVAKFSMVTDKSYKDKKGEWQKLSSWHNIVAWRSLAERCEKQLAKGYLIYVEGELTYGKYTDKNNVERYTTDITVHTIKVLDKPDGSAKPAGSSTPAAAPPEEDPGNFDDLPF